MTYYLFFLLGGVGGCGVCVSLSLGFTCVRLFIACIFMVIVICLSCSFPSSTSCMIVFVDKYCLNFDVFMEYLVFPIDGD